MICCGQIKEDQRVNYNQSPKMSRCIALLLLISMFNRNVNSQECTSGSIRLVNGDSRSGNMQVCVNNIWGRLCNDFDTMTGNALHVICRQLGIFNSTIGVISFSFSNENYSEPFLLHNVSCSGNESSLFQCNYDALNQNCISPINLYVNCFSESCVLGSIRLINGNSSNNGRVELCENLDGNVRIWTTLCDHYWGTSEAQVVCRQLGLPTEGAMAYGQAQFGKGSGIPSSIHPSCSGNENSIFQCNDVVPNYKCTHDEDAGISCLTSVAHTTMNAILPMETSVVVNDNSLKVSIDGFTIELFTESYEISFKEATVYSINNYCANNVEQCNGVTITKRQNGWIPVAVDNVKIRSITNSPSGIEIITYVALSVSSVLPINAFNKAILNGISSGLYSRSGFISVTAKPLTLTVVETSIDLSVVGVVIGVIVFLSTTLIIVTAIGIKMKKVVLNKETDDKQENITTSKNACYDTVPRGDIITTTNACYDTVPLGDIITTTDAFYDTVPRGDIITTTNACYGTGPNRQREEY